MRERGVGGGGWGVGGMRFALIVVLVLGCGQKGQVDSDTVNSTTTPHTPTPIANAPTHADCPADGLWHTCSLTKRLEMSGFVLQKEAEGVREAPLNAEGTRYALGQSSLIVFLYPSEGARITDQARLDTTRYIDPYQPISMRQEPSRIASANLLAIHRSRSDRQRARVADALTAGPPQGSGAKP
jgi:hypothetical protein